MLTRLLISTCAITALATLAACTHSPREKQTAFVAQATPKPDPVLSLDGKKLGSEKTRQLLYHTPIQTFRVTTSAKLNERDLQAHVLHKDEFVFVHSHRDFWSPRASGQAFFDTFLFGCLSLPPSPLDRVVNESMRMQKGESVLIEEYPDRIATPEGQDFALIRCDD